MMKLINKCEEKKKSAKCIIFPLQADAAITNFNYEKQRHYMHVLALHVKAKGS